MKLLNRLEKAFPRFGIPNLTIYLILGQFIFFALDYLKILPLDKIALTGIKVLDGEYWRLLTFLFIPISRNIYFIIFSWYIYYLYGSALENTWGTFKYNIFVLLSFILTVSISFVMPNSLLSNGYLYATIFLAFAYLYPDFVLYIFFILPVRIKWLALLTWIYYFYVLLFSPVIDKILLLVSIGNFLLFFYQDIILRIRFAKTRMEGEVKSMKIKNEHIHKCSVCGKTDLDDPNMHFRYCDSCKELTCFCMDHINNHTHN
jgi:hypothetical protein